MWEGGGLVGGKKEEGGKEGRKEGRKLNKASEVR